MSTFLSYQSVTVPREAVIFENTGSYFALKCMQFSVHIRLFQPSLVTMTKLFAVDSELKVQSNSFGMSWGRSEGCSQMSADKAQVWLFCFGLGFFGCWWFFYWLLQVTVMAFLPDIWTTRLLLTELIHTFRK